MSLNHPSLPFHQIILLKNDGKVRYSCETLISLRDYNSDSLLSTSPFLESIYPQLMLRDTAHKALRYGRMEGPFPGLEGTYDFSFKWVEIHDGKFILWNIYDLSDLYKEIRQAQQLRNEHAISSERLRQISRKEFNNWEKNGRYLPK